MAASVSSNNLFRSPLWAGIPLLIHLACWFIIKPSFPFTDGYIYTIKAYNVLDGTFQLTPSHFDNRFGMILPVALIIKVFGLTPYTLALWPLACSLFSIFLIYHMGRRLFSPTTGFIAACLLASNNSYIDYSASLFPDVPLALFSTFFAYAVLNGRKGSRPAFYTALICLSALAGMITKEMIVLPICFMIFIFAIDLRNKQHTAFWKKAIPALLICFILYMFAYYLVTGDWFYRIKGVEMSHSHIWTSGLYPEGLAARLSYLPLLFINEHLAFLLPLLLALPAVIYYFKSKTEPAGRYWTLYTIVLLTELWLGSFSLKGISPIVLWPRMWLLLIPPLCLLAAMSLQQDKSRLLGWLFLSAAVINYFFFPVNRSLLLLSFSMFLFLASYFNNRRAMQVFIPFIFLGIGIYFSVKNSNYLLFNTDDFMKSSLAVLEKEDNILVISDHDMAEQHIIYNNMKPYANMHWIRWTEPGDTNIPYSKAYLLGSKEKLKAYLQNNELFWEDERVIKDSEKYIFAEIVLKRQ